MSKLAAPAAMLSLAISACASVDASPVLSQIGQSATEAAHHAPDAARKAALMTGAPITTPISSPASLAGREYNGLPMPAPKVEQYAANSLWQAGSRTFFNDQRAGRVGDLLTVRIDIDDSASVSNESDRSRSSQSTVGIEAAMGAESYLQRLLPGQVDPTNLVGASGSSTANGKGTIERGEKIALTVAAVVVDILPNGNLVISGRQEVRVNSELRELTVAGIIRPEDIAADNTIRHTQIAEARVSYGGRGQLMAVQRPRWGQRVADVISPW